jgi:hypothetical protein
LRPNGALLNLNIYENNMYNDKELAQQAPADCANFEPQPHRLVKLTLSPEDRQNKPQDMVRENGLIHKRNACELTLPELAADAHRAAQSYLVLQRTLRHAQGAKF